MDTSPPSLNHTDSEMINTLDLIRKRREICGEHKKTNLTDRSESHRNKIRQSNLDEERRSAPPPLQSYPMQPSIRPPGTAGSPEPGNMVINPFVDVNINIQMSRGASFYFAALLVGHAHC